MKPLPNASEYGLVPLPPMADTQGRGNNEIQRLTADDVGAAGPAVMWIELREIAWLASIVIGLSILSVGAAVALAFAL